MYTGHDISQNLLVLRIIGYGKNTLKISTYPLVLPQKSHVR